MVLFLKGRVDVGRGILYHPINVRLRMYRGRRGRGGALMSDGWWVTDDGLGVKGVKGGGERGRTDMKCQAADIHIAGLFMSFYFCFLEHHLQDVLLHESH